MKKLYIVATLLVAFAVIAPLMSAAQSKVVRLTRYEGKAITGVSASSAFDIYLVKSDQTKAVIEVSEELESRVNTSFDNGTVSVSMSSGSGNNRNKNTVMKMTLYLPEVKLIKASGAVTIRSTDSFNSDNTVISILGASDIKQFTTNTGNLSIECTGASNATINATAGKVKCNAIGASNIKLTVDCGYIDAIAIGASDMTIKGKAGEAKITATGASNLKAGDLEVKKIKAAASGASDATVWATNELSASASGASSLKYKGTPTIFETHSSGASSVKKIVLK